MAVLDITPVTPRLVARVILALALTIGAAADVAMAFDRSDDHHLLFLRAHAMSREPVRGARPARTEDRDVSGSFMSPVPASVVREWQVPRSARDAVHELDRRAGSGVVVRRDRHCIAVRDGARGQAVFVWVEQGGACS